MAINSVAIQSFESVSQTRLSYKDHSTQAQRNEKAEGEQPLSASQQRKAELNASILQSNYSVSLSTQNNPSSLLFKSALEAINKELEPTLGKNAAQKAFDEGIDFSPEATAGRIVDFATSFFPLYQQQHSGNGESLEKQLDSFLNVVGGGVEQGFGEAKDILTGLKVFNGEIEENANATYDLIYEGFAKFKENVLGANEKETAVA